MKSLNRIKRILPWDLNFTQGGHMVLFFAIMQEITIISWASFAVDLRWWGIALVFLPGALVLVLLWFMRHDSPQMWAHFVGTDVRCRDQAHQDAMLDWAWANHRLWSEFTDNVANIDKVHSIRFLSREKALLAKLSVP